MKAKGWLLWVLAGFVAFSFGAPKLAAQSAITGSIVGTVTDPSGAVVPNAKIELKDNAKGTTQTGKSNNAGVYEFDLLAPSNYTITVTAQGFESASRTVDVRLGQPATANLALSIAGGGTTITVTEAEPLVQTENGDTATTLNQQQVSQVPNPGNDLSYIAQIAPGVVENTQNGQGNFSSFGLPATSNLFTLNGMDDNDPFLNVNNSGATNLLLGQNEVQEAAVVTNGYSGQFGTLAGTNINYITKSGSNQFHGDATYYWNGRTLNANDFFLNQAGKPRAFDNANQWAGSLGGPIKSDKLFFFFNTEGLRVVIPTSSQVLVPDPNFESATLANIAANGNAQQLNFYKSIFNFYDTAPGRGTATPFTACPAALGIGGNCSDTFRSSISNLTHEYQISGRVDWNIGASDRAFIRYQYDNGVQATFTDPINSLFNDISTQPEHQGQLVETHSFGATATNQVIVAGQWYTALFGPTNLQQTLAAFPTTLAFADGSFSNVGGNDAGLGEAIFPQGRNVTQYQVQDDVSKIIGNHTLKFGGKFRRNDISDHDFGFFQSGFLLTNIGDFFNGKESSSSSFTQSFPSSLNEPIAIYELSSYVEDAWRVRPSLTLTFALRAEHPSNPVCQHLCFAQLNGPFNQVSHDPNQPFNQAIDINRKQALLGLSNINWAPRFSFAWQPLGTTHNLVVRGGIGLFYDVFPGTIADNVSQNPPLDNTFVIAGTTTSAPTISSPGDPSSVFASARASNQAFLSGFTAGQTLAQIQASDPAFGTPGITVTDRLTHAPEYQKWSLEVQKGFGANTSASIGYNGTHGVFEPVINNGVNAFGFATLPAAAPDSRFSTVTEVTSAGRSNYNGVTGSVQHRFTRWTQGIFQANYTFSHAFDDVSNGGFLPFTAANSILNPENPNNIRANYGPSDYDVRHYFNANYVWEVPVKQALRGHGSDYLTRGWQLSGAIFARSGFPFTVIDGATSGSLRGQNFGGFVFPSFVGGPVSSCGQRAASGTPCLSTSNFATAGFGPPGLRNLFRGPGYTDVDFTVVKNTKLPKWERGELGLGLQFFNLFNHPNFNLPVSDIANPKLFGTINSAVNPPTSILGSFLGGDASPRLIQVKAQLTF